MNENHITLAAKLYKCRNTCIRLWGKDWKKQVEFHTNLIKAAMKKHNLKNEIAAAIKLAKEAENEDGADVFTMKLLAAAVELVEPTKD